MSEDVYDVGEVKKILIGSRILLEMRSDEDISSRLLHTIYTSMSYIVLYIQSTTYNGQTQKGSD